MPSPPWPSAGGGSSESIGAIQRIRSDYLAEVLGNYMALPPDLRAQPMLGDCCTPESACVERAKWIVVRLQRIRLEYYQCKADRIGTSDECLKSRLDLAPEPSSESAAIDNQVIGRIPDVQGGCALRECRVIYPVGWGLWVARSFELFLLKII